LNPSLPIIDLKSAQDEEIYLALMEYGFFYLKNHGVPSALINSLKKNSVNFFRESAEFKNKINMKKSGKAWRGYFALGEELTSGQPDHKEGIYFGEEHSHTKWPLHGPNQWPVGKSYHEFKADVLSYMDEMKNLGGRLLQAVALSLSLPQDYFARRFTNQPTTLFRIFNYPFSELKKWGVQEHTDMGFLTILLQDDKPGLEVQCKNGSWLAVPPLENTFVVNIGDMLQLWTQGIFRATPHRVKNLSSADRLSFPYFYDPNWQATLEPIEAVHLKNLDKVVTSSRWDGLELEKLSKDLTYGEFVWKKVKKVFPH